jgi:hypothetical protein
MVAEVELHRLVTKYMWVTSTGFVVTDRNWNYVKVFSREEMEAMYPNEADRPERIPGSAIVMKEKI